MLGLLDKINYAVVFGSFAGSVFYETPLDALGAVLLSALIIKTLTFLNSQELLHIIRLITRHTHDGGYSRKK